jgi:hypothetical protein
MVLIVGLASIASGLMAPRETSSPDGPVCAARMGRWVTHWSHKPHKRHSSVPGIVPANDPSDDGTSRDPDDDDDTKSDIGVDDETEVPIFACLNEAVCYLIATEARLASAWTETPSPRFLTLQRLRC